MSEQKKYTAQEMREMAYAIVNECTDEENGLVYESRYHAGHVFYPEDASAMLRQAAEMRERIDDLLLTFHSCPDQRDMLNYILRGDAGKEEK